MSGKNGRSQAREHLVNEVANDAKMEALAALRARIHSAAQVSNTEPELGHISDLIDTRPLLHVALQAHLLDDSIERGASIIFWGDPEGVGGCLSLPYLGVKGFTNAQSIQEALDAFEWMLGNPEFKWKRETQPKGRKRNSYGKATGRS